MAKDIPSVGDHRRNAIVSDAELAAAADAYLADPKGGPFAFQSGHTIDVAQAVEQHPRAKKVLSDPANKDLPKFQRAMVMTAITMGLPERAMKGDIDPVLEGVGALRARGIEATLHGGDVERWKVGDLQYNDAGLLRLAERFGGKERKG